MTNVKVYFVNDAIDQLKIDTWDTLLNDYGYYIDSIGR